MVLLKPGLEPFENIYGLLNRRLHHVHFLKAPGQSRVFLENAPVFGEGRRANALERAGAQAGLEQVGGIQRAPRCSTRAYEGVDFVNEQNGIRLVFKRFQDAFEPLLEISTVLCSSQQGAHVERVNHGVGKNFGHILLGNAPCQALGNGGLANPRLANQQRVVFAPATQNLDHPLDFVLATNQRIYLAIAG